MTPHNDVLTGRVIGFDANANQGEIMAEDGTRYLFLADSWEAMGVPHQGESVQFGFDDMGKVINVMRHEQTASSVADAGSSSINSPVSSSSQHVDNHHNPNSHTSVNQSHANATGNQNQAYDGTNNHYTPPTTQTLPSQAQDDALYAKYAQEADYNIIDWTKKCFANYATFSGRARRKEYWLFYLATMLVSFAISMFSFVLGDIAEVISGIWSLAVFIPTFAVGSRRLHDIGKSGWWQLLWLIPIIGWIVIIIWLATETIPASNEWGMPAKPVHGF